MSEELKPCPFCGYDNPEMIADQKDRWTVSCRNCLAKIDYGAAYSYPKEEAIRDWNTRVDVAQKRPEEVESGKGHKLCPNCTGEPAGYLYDNHVSDCVVACTTCGFRTGNRLSFGSAWAEWDGLPRR